MRTEEQITLAVIDALLGRLQLGGRVEDVLGAPDALLFEGSTLDYEDVKALLARRQELGRALTEEEAATILRLRRP